MGGRGLVVCAWLVYGYDCLYFYCFLFSGLFCQSDAAQCMHKNTNQHTNNINYWLIKSILKVWNAFTYIDSVQELQQQQQKKKQYNALRIRRGDIMAAENQRENIHAHCSHSYGEHFPRKIQTRAHSPTISFIFRSFKLFNISLALSLFRFRFHALALSRIVHTLFLVKWYAAIKCLVGLLLISFGYVFRVERESDSDRTKWVHISSNN